MVMIVSKITPSLTFKGNNNGTPKATVPHKAPRAGSLVKLAMLGSLATAPVVLTGCPSDSNPPVVDTIPPKGGEAGTAGIGGNTGGVGGATTTPATTDNAVKRMNRMWEAMGFDIAYPDEAQGKVEYTDDFNGDKTVLSNPKVSADGNTTVYKALTGADDSGVVTYKYDPTKDVFTEIQVGDGTGATVTSVITSETNPATGKKVAVFTNTATGEVQKWFKSGEGEITICDRNYKKLRTFSGLTFTMFNPDGSIKSSYIAKLNKADSIQTAKAEKSPIVKFAGQAQEKLAALAKKGRQLADRFELPAKATRAGKHLAKNALTYA